MNMMNMIHLKKILDGFETMAIESAYYLNKNLLKIDQITLLHICYTFIELRCKT